MHEQEQLEQLTRMRRIAGGLLLVMAVLFVVAKSLQPRFGWLAFVGAFAEAAMVGGLADWFAITALFRHPLGLPIPHTAILPRNKDRLGESIANFLQHNFMTREVLRDELARVDFAGAAADWLLDEANRKALAGNVVHGVPALLRLVEDKDADDFLRRALGASFGHVKFAPILGQVLGVLVAGRQHHVLLERILGIVARAFEQNRGYIRQKVHENSPRWIPRQLDEKFFERLIEGIESILAEIQAEDSEWRERFEAATHELIDKLSTSQEYEDRLRAMIANSLGHPLFLAYLQELWQDIRQRLLADTSAPDSRTAAWLAAALLAFGRALEQDAAIRARLNQWLRAIAADAIVERRAVIASVVRRVIRSWDAETVARKFELYVGRDLQYIRVNGTLVGGSVGLLLYIVSLAF
jgi:uncharacterized membrane-anchored protein YjiN (DUF445 family)